MRWHRATDLSRDVALYPESTHASATLNGLAITRKKGFLPKDPEILWNRAFSISFYIYRLEIDMISMRSLERKYTKQCKTEQLIVNILVNHKYITVALSGHFVALS